ncbi:fused MFS/spermidine synthase [Piscinibacter koreensis]|nr:fused MFS/spermidine synthase [Schlegelella koreensis]
MLLAIYLIGSALGAAAYHRWLLGSNDATRLRDRLLCGLTAACLFGAATLWGAEFVKAGVLHLLGTSMGAALLAESILAAAAFLVPTVVMGAVFSHLAAMAIASGVGLGRALAANTVGAALAPFVFGVVVQPALGSKTALMLAACAYLALCSRRAGSAPSPWVTASLAAALALLTPALVFVALPSGAQLVSYHEGALGAVSVVEDAAGVATLRIDNRQQEGSSATRSADARQALLPLLLHPAPRRALFLGLGTGVTASAAAEDPDVYVDVVELLPEVIEASAWFASSGAAAARMNVMAADARRFVRVGQQRYDLIVADNFHPARGGSGALYTVEHFRAVRDRLGQRGLFCQWLPLHQLDRATLQSIIKSFLVANPGAFAILATHSLDTPVLGLVARADGGRFELGEVRSRLAHANLAPTARLGLDDELALLGAFVAGPKALARFAAEAPANTDDLPVVAYLAPRITYAPGSRPRDRLVDLLRELSLVPAELLAAPPAGLASRLAAYWQARDVFIEAGRDVRPSNDVEQMLAQVREPLVAALRISPDFRPAYDPLLRMAIALADRDPAAARLLLTELRRLQPTRPEAARQLLELGMH